MNKSTEVNPGNSSIDDVFGLHQKHNARAIPQAEGLGASPISKLSPRKLQVLQLLAEGSTMKSAAEVLGISTRTIAFHKYDLMKICGLKTNADLIRLAVREHLIKYDS